MKLNRKDIWIIRSKEGDSILEMPDGTNEFDNEYKAKIELQKYKHRDKYFVLQGSKKVQEKAGDKIDSFMKN